jgi:hypothetical protein
MNSGKVSPSSGSLAAILAALALVLVAGCAGDTVTEAADEPPVEVPAAEELAEEDPAEEAPVEDDGAESADEEPAEATGDGERVALMYNPVENMGFPVPFISCSRTGDLGLTLAVDAEGLLEVEASADGTGEYTWDRDGGTEWGSATVSANDDGSFTVALTPPWEVITACE